MELDVLWGINETTQTEFDVYFCKCLVCKKTLALRSGTYLANHPKIPLLVLARIIFYYFPRGSNAKEAQKALKLDGNYDLSYQVINQIYREIRGKILSMFYGKKRNVETLTK